MVETEPNRRPLASRGTWWAKAFCARLAKTGATPNQVSVASIGFAAFAGGMFLLSSQNIPTFLQGVAMLFAAVGIQGRLLCNMLDGMLAVESGQRSPVGEIYNDFPDRIADLIIILGAGASISAEHTIFFSGITLGWLAATLAIFTAYIRLLGAASGTKHFFLGPMAKPHRMALLTGAALFATYQYWSGGELKVIAAALWIMIIGSAITCLRRTLAISRELRSRPG